MSVSENLKTLKVNFPEQVLLIAVSKFKPNEDILEAYETGQRDFGENYVQELVLKSDTLPVDIKWHFIGHLQSNKVKYIAPFVHLIHAVDSFKLLKEINRQALMHNRVIECLLQIHIADEETKSGMTPEDFYTIISDHNLRGLKNVRVIGVMGMSTFTDDKEKIRKEFKTLRAVFESGKEKNSQLTEISMGMSGDWKIAVEEGATMVRIGSTIFGSRS